MQPNYLFALETKENEEVKGVCNDIGSIHASMSCLDIRKCSQSKSIIQQI